MTRNSFYVFSLVITILFTLTLVFSNDLLFTSTLKDIDEYLKYLQIQVSGKNASQWYGIGLIGRDEIWWYNLSQCINENTINYCQGGLAKAKGNIFSSVITGQVFFPYYLNLINKLSTKMYFYTGITISLCFLLNAILVRMSGLRKISILSTLIFIFLITSNPIPISWSFSLYRDPLIILLLSIYAHSILFLRREKLKKNKYKKRTYGLIFMYILSASSLIMITPRYSLIIIVISIIIYSKKIFLFLRVISIFAIFAATLSIFKIDYFGSNSGFYYTISAFLGPNPLTSLVDITNGSELYLVPFFAFLNFFIQIPLIAYCIHNLFFNKSPENDYEAIFYYLYFPTLLCLLILPVDVLGFRQFAPSATLLAWGIFYKFSNKYNQYKIRKIK